MEKIFLPSIIIRSLARILVGYELNENSSFSIVGENQQVPDRSSPVNGPGLAKPVSMSSTTNPAGKKRIDAALEKNIETIVTQVRRTTTKPSQLTQNDLELFDSTTSNDSLKNGHQSRETTPNTSNSNHKHASSSSREMTPDSINTDSANEDQQQTIRNGHHYPRSINHHYHHHPPPPSSPSTNVDLTTQSNSPYMQQQPPPPWPPTVYPFAHQHPGLYLPYPPPPLPTNSTPTNGLPPFYPSYDPVLIEQHYGPQGLSAFYTQQQQQQARLLQEHSNMSGTPNNSPLFRESPSLTDIFNNSLNNKQFSTRLNSRLTNLNEQQQMMLSHLYLNQITSLPYVTLYDTASSACPRRSNGDIGENDLLVLNVVSSSSLC